MIKLYVNTSAAHAGRPMLDTARYYRNESYLFSLIQKLDDAQQRALGWASKANPWAENDFASGRLGAYAGTGLSDQIRDSYVAAGSSRPLDMYFLHAADPETPLSCVVEAMGAALRKEQINRWGLSNFSLSTCQELYRVCEDEGVAFASVYQGMYNVFCRRVEEVFPFLRSRGMTFWAYNPLLGGLVCRAPALTDTQEAKKSGRFANPIYQNIFLQPSIVRACSMVARDGGGARLALTWLRDESLLTTEDRVILGASSLDQLSRNLDMWTRSIPLSEDEKTQITTAFSSIDPTEIPNYWY